MTIRDLIKDKDVAATEIIAEITHICKDFEKRSPGTKGEEQAAEYYKKVLLEECGCDEAYVESFKENPGAFYGWIPIDVTAALASIGIYFKAPAVSAGIISGALALALSEFGLYNKTVDFLFPEKTGHNVTAFKKPTGEIKQRIIFNGHLDAAWEWPVNYALGGVGFESHAILGFASLFYYLVLSIIASKKSGPFTAITSGSLKKLGKYGFGFLPFLIGLYGMVDYRRVVDGANDNLTGCEMGVEILRKMEEAGIDLEHTEVGVVLTGSEEAGLRGAKAWCEAHAGEFQDVPTYIYSYDTIHDPKQLMVNYRDLNGTVAADKEVSDLFMKAAEDIDIFCKKGWVPPLGGSTDSAAFAQGGFRVTGITGLNHKLESYYHTRKDTYTNMSPEGIADCYAVSLETLAKFDEGER